MIVLHRSASESGGNNVLNWAVKSTMPNLFVTVNLLCETAAAVVNYSGHSYATVITI